MLNEFNNMMYVVRDSLKYSIFEVAFLLIVIYDGWGGDALSPFVVYGIAAIAILWLIASNYREAIEEAREMVLHRELFQTDFLMSACILTLIAVVFYTKDVELYIVAIVLLAAGQNLRYTMWVNRWIADAIDEQRREDDGNSDKDV